MRKKKIQFYAGQQLGRYTLIKSAGITKGTKRGYWYASCGCGFSNNKLVNPYKLRKNTTASCGCLREEIAVELSVFRAEKRAKLTAEIEEQVKNIPENVKDWLVKFGNGDIKKGVSRLKYYLNRDKESAPPKKLFKRVKW